MDIATIIAVVSAYIIKGVCGFANTLVFGTIMSYSKDNINITPVDLLIGYPSNIFIAWKERKGISKKLCIRLSILVILGSIPGVIFLKIGNAQLIKVLFGIVVVLIGIETLFRERKKDKIKSSNVLLMIIGIMSGILCGLFGIGALLVAYISRTTSNQKQFRGNICIVFLVDNTFRIILYIITGVLNWHIFVSAIMLLPFMIIGLSIGTLLSNKMSEVIVKKVVIIMLVISGITLIINNLISV